MILNVLWSLGWSMVILGFLVRLPLRVVAVISITTILLHNAFSGPLLVHRPGVLTVGGVVVIGGYTLVPWFAVMAAGYCFGPVVVSDRRRTVLLRLGRILTAAFLVLRVANVYGDPRPWTAPALSFLNTTKYPPSLQFLLMTLGPAMLIWSWLDRLEFRPSNPLIVFGRVPLFYFLGHLFLIHGLLYPAVLASYGTVEFLRNPLPSMGGSIDSYPPGFGYDLPVVYAVWALVVALMYPVCRWFAAKKASGKHRWLQYV